MSVRRCRHCAHMGTVHVPRPARIGAMAHVRCSAWGCNCPGFEPAYEIPGPAYCPTCGVRWAPEEAARAAKTAEET